MRALPALKNDFYKIIFGLTWNIKFLNMFLLAPVASYVAQLIDPLPPV
jgi:hypothetical protein